MTRILVTGANGFVGRRLVERLIAGGRHVRCAVRTLGSGPDEPVVVGNIGAETDWKAALAGIDAVVHLAGRAHIVRADKNALALFRAVNADGTARLAEQAEREGIRRFVMISSVKAAAETCGPDALHESDPPKPHTPYGISKWEGEQALCAAARQMETVILRPPLVYGPGVRANFLSLLRLIDSGLLLPLGSVSNRRSLIALDNLVDAIVVALDAPGVAGGTFYVADGAPLSTPELIRRLARALGRPARLVPFPPALLSLAGSLLGYKESVDSLIGSLAIDDSAFRGAADWAPPVTTEMAFNELAAWYRAQKR